MRHNAGYFAPPAAASQKNQKQKKSSASTIAGQKGIGAFFSAKRPTSGGAKGGANKRLKKAGK